jgi:zinc transport system ATP-binding protein
MPDHILSVKNLTVTRNDHRILEDLSFDVESGETLAVIGPNGAGKTTLLRAILGLIPYEGIVTWKKDVKIGYVPQRLYIESDIPLTTKEFFFIKQKNKKDIKEVLQAVGLSGEGSEMKEIEKHILNNKLGNLSGGELQRVLIAWSLLGDPDVLLYDEPTSGVDIAGEETVYTMLEKLKKIRGLTIILISHEIEIVRHFTTSVLCLNKEKVCHGPPREVITQKTIEKLFGEETNYYGHDHKF